MHNSADWLPSLFNRSPYTRNEKEKTILPQLCEREMVTEIQPKTYIAPHSIPKFIRAAFLRIDKKRTISKWTKYYVIEC